jgi:hypothetical protein
MEIKCKYELFKALNEKIREYEKKKDTHDLYIGNKKVIPMVVDENKFIELIK